MTKYNGTGRLIERGFLATHKQDFLSHVYGNDYRHAYFVFVGGENDNVDYRVGSDEYPTFNDAMSGALADTRLSNGGIIIIKAGTYTITDTIEVPSKISLVGESTETILVGETDELPLFKILKSTKNVYIDESTILTFDGYVDACTFKDLVLTDNSNQTIKSASHAKATMTTVPMIQCEIESYFICKNVKFFGRLNYGPQLNRVKTLCAVGYTSTGSSSTKLTLDQCFFDGMKIGVNFNPDNGNLDFLSVTNCKARVYGNEGQGQSTSEESFINMSLCNHVITNNYVVHQTQINDIDSYLVNISTASGDLTNIKGIINSNLGLPNSDGYILHDDTFSTFESVISGNNWSNNQNNQWFITVGSSIATPVDTKSSIGDLNGPGAINLLFKLGIRDCTVIVNPGCYEVTGNYVGEGYDPQITSTLKFIGNKMGGIYPVFYLDSMSAVDSINNRYINLGCHLESIQFVSFNFSGRYNSVHVNFGGFGGATCEINDCIFTDCALVADDFFLSLDSVGNFIKTRLVVKDCQFNQTQTFDSNISIFVPSIDDILLEGCVFSGPGYAGKIGSNADKQINVVLKDCHFYPGVIGAVNGYVSGYFQIEDYFANVVIDNCDFGKNQFNKQSLISVPTIFDFIKITACDIFINNSYFDGPNSTYTGYNELSFNIVCLALEPKTSLKLTNSRFYGGALPCQVRAMDQFAGNYGNNGIITIKDCEFIDTNSDNYTLCATLLDIDIEFTNYFMIEDNSIVIEGCKFEQKMIYSLPGQIYHTNLADGYYTDQYTNQGAVQIFAPCCNVKFVNNSISSYVVDSGYYTSGGALLIDTLTSTRGQSYASARARKTFVSNNDIFLKVIGPYMNDYDRTAVNLRSAVVIANDNHIRINSSNVSSTNAFVGALYLKTDGYHADSNSNIHYNIFSNLDDDGNSENLRVGFVYIHPDSGKGFFTDNTFTSTSYKIKDESADGNWLIDRNRNILISSKISGYLGKMSFQSSNKTTNNGFYLTPVTDTTSFIYEDSGNVVATYQSAGTSEDILWSIDLKDVLPLGAKIISTYLSYQVDAVPDTTKSVSLSITSDAGTESETDTIPNTNEQLLRLIPALTHIIKEDSTCNILFKSSIEDSGSNIVLTLTDFYIKYTY